MNMPPTRSLAARPAPSLRALAAVLLNRRNEWLVVVLLPLALAVALYAAGEASLLRSVRDWLAMSATTDSWHPMERALRLMHQPGSRVYLDLFFGEGVKFQYPPSSLIVHELAARLGVPLTANGLNLVNWVLVWAYAGVCAWFGLRMADGSRAGGPAGVDRAMVGLLAGCAGLLSYPVIKAFTLGQVQLWIDLAFAAACLAWMADRKVLCGVLVGAVCLVKPQFSLFLLWAAIRLELRFAAGWAAVVGAGMAVSLAWFGVQNHLDYLRVLSALSSTGEAYYPNQSVNGILNRLLGTAPATVWEPNGFPRYHLLVHLGTLASSAALIGATLLYRRKQRAQVLDFQAAALAFTVASPIAWEHHYGILPPMLVALYFAIGRLADPDRVRTRYAILAVCCLLASGHLGVAHWADAGVATLLHSYLFAAAAGVLYLLFDASRQPTRSRPAGRAARTPA
jgi:hypothetical protein